ncbi:hypothetical protein C1N91_02030 [Curtobacterium sp. SGAir0471]|uniref:hypothetical protein n=1 Tax=Curtobacterium sp. SGAir0471 TaxID=2070337 RepID=UPI0010CCCF83|nr:hypothetical protein [Curtobacterium sp. SGAir0471]QCR42503.1 hypothetical protein C1N91_02030 [Curtobacterium sp. SGAir0471]
MELLRLAIWVVFCLVVVTTQQSRPVVTLSAVIALRLLVPSTAGGLLVGAWEGNAALHPATILVIVHCVFGLRSQWSSVAAEVPPRRGWYAGLVVVAFLLVVQAVVGSGPTSLLGLTNAVLAPMLFCFVARTSERAVPGTLRRLAVVVIGVMLVVAAVVVIQVVLRSDLPWGPVGGRGAVGTGQFRPRGTLDSPLDLGFAAAVAIPLASFVRRAPIRLVVALVLLSTVVLTASRAPTAVALAGTLWVVVRSTRSFVAVLTIVISGCAAVLVAVRTSLLSGLVERVTGDDGSSASARGAAARYIVEHIWDHTFIGGGWGAAWQLKGAVLRTSLENSFAILAFDLGLIPVVVFVLVLLRPSFDRSAPVGARLAVVVGVFLGFCYSGFATMSAASTVLWLAVALCGQWSARAAQESGPPLEDVRRPDPHDAHRGVVLAEDALVPRRERDRVVD